MTEMDEEKKRELRVKIEYQVSCEEKAFRIVERLIENPITSDFLLDAVAFITPNHYIDVTEERAVSGLCGYPVCQKPLSHVPKQKYFISTKTNKVYDIENRKNFCSGRCYKASKHLEQQISTEPVWSRKNQPRKKLELLPMDMKTGQIGDEVVVSKREEMTHEMQRLSDLDQYGESLKGRGTSGTKERNVAPVRESSADSGGGECYTALAEMDISEHKDGDKKSITSNNTDICDQQLSPLTVDTHVGSMCESDDKVSMNQNSNQSMSKVKHNRKEVAPSSNRTDKMSKFKHKSTQSKTDYLMQLLDKRKSLLSKMADIQPQNNVTVTSEVSPGNKPDLTEEGGESGSITSKQNARYGITTETCDGGKTDFAKDDSKSEEVGKIETGDNGKFVSVNDDSEIQKVNATDNVEETKCSGKLMKHSVDRPVCESGPNSVKQQQQQQQRLTVVDLVCEVIRSWITSDSSDFLKDTSGKDAVGKTTAFTEQYRALVAKVDAQENDLSNMIGEESMTPDDVPSAPAPHYEFLKEEAERNQLRVREYMKGSFTYRETDVVQKEQIPSNVKLPTVDRYDQMLIRQKIVLDKISKVLPDILMPLHLLIQDVFTELKELVFTFNFTSENILLKPAEWTLITIVLLKMLSNKIIKLQEAFLHPGADIFFTKLLTGLGESVGSIDRHVASLLAL